ncbi:MAG: HAD-IIIA family hydrolase [Magnetococcales bacterium]|nr:HAD-IIIA family hydrolase [Magnetococcales bacterium]
MTPAGVVFLDRDGVITREVFYPSSGEWEAPMQPGDLELLPGALEALVALTRAGWPLAVVSNQAAFAKGKVALASLLRVHEVFVELLARGGVQLADAFYSYSHPEGVVPGFSGPSLERKPGHLFLVLGAARHGWDLGRSWMVGDRDSDVEAGLRAGCRTVQLANPRAGSKAGSSSPHFRANTLTEASDIILRHGG